MGQLKSMIGTVQVEGRSLPCKACRAAYLKAVGAAEAVVQRLGDCAEDGFEFCHLIARLTSSEALDALVRVCRTSTMTSQAGGLRPRQSRT